VRQIVTLAGPEAGAFVHWGATTQDFMDTATALQVRDAEKLVAADLATVTREVGLQVPAIAWHTSRDGLAEFVCVLGLISASLGKLAQEVALLQRTEIGEVEEGYQPGRGGSSTMPQKRNPIASEDIIGASRVVRQLVPAMLDAMLHDGERATGPWHAEWLAIPEAAILTHGQLAHTRELLDGLVVNTERMRHNLGLSRGLITSEAVMMALAPKIGRQPAHDVVYEAPMRAIERDRPLRDELLEDSTVAGALSAAEVDDLLRPERYVGLASQFVDRVLEQGGG
jgi:3-carboxy-cis,cis-muconate cycloisomerase